MYDNPVISGFYPDPSVCRVGEDYYLVTSTFEYFPGVPVFHSRDLVHWQQIGHCLTRDSQLPLQGATPNTGGIYAPTLREHQGIFYMVTTNVSHGWNFYVTATDPAGPWSEPIYVDQGGIDPSLFFDDDGTVYFCSNAGGGISTSTIDIASGQRLTEPRLVWLGTGGRWAEAPHLYKINGQYYLMIAEGGTEYGHMETIARSDSPWGPFTPCPHNPILSHRNRGADPVQGTGHADLIQAHDGSWWLVCLAFRIFDGNYHHLGRETFLAPVQWTADGWPIVGDHGAITLHVDAPTLPLEPWPLPAVRDEFTATTPCLQWNYLRNPYRDDYTLTARPGWLRLRGSALTLDAVDSPTFLGRRQQHPACRVATLLDFTPDADGEEAGLTVYMGAGHHYEVGVMQEDGQRTAFLRRRIGDLVAVTARQPVPDGPLVLQITAEPECYTFAVGAPDAAPTVLGTGQTRHLSSEVAGGFTGVYFGLYATGTGHRSTAPADFDWFDYEPLV